MNNLNNVIGINKSEPGNKAVIQSIENEMNVKLPKGYRELLEYTDGFST